MSARLPLRLLSGMLAVVIELPFDSLSYFFTFPHLSLQRTHSVYDTSVYLERRATLTEGHHTLIEYS